MSEKNPKVIIMMGSKNDWEVMKPASDILKEFGVPHEAVALSAHRTPEESSKIATEARGKGVQVIIAGAGGAAHLAGVLASKTTIPVLGVPISATSLNGLDSLLATVQMPKGIPVPTLAIGKAGSANAGLAAISILSLNDKGLAEKLEEFRSKNREKVLADSQLESFPG